MVVPNVEVLQKLCPEQNEPPGAGLRPGGGGGAAAHRRFPPPNASAASPRTAPPTRHTPAPGMIRSGLRVVVRTEKSFGRVQEVGVRLGGRQRSGRPRGRQWRVPWWRGLVPGRQGIGNRGQGIAIKRRASRRLPAVPCPLSPVPCPLSPVPCPLSPVPYPLCFLRLLASRSSRRSCAASNRSRSSSVSGSTGGTGVGRPCSSRATKVA